MQNLMYEEPFLNNLETLPPKKLIEYCPWRSPVRGRELECAVFARKIRLFGGPENMPLLLKRAEERGVRRAHLMAVGKIYDVTEHAHNRLDIVAGWLYHELGLF